MLGKGLESLIPPKRSDTGQSGDSGAPHNPSQAQHSGSPQHQPAHHPRPVSDISATPFTIHSEPIEDIVPPLPVVAPRYAPPAPPIARAMDIEPKNSEKQSVFHIEVDRIRPNPHQPRREFDEVALRELASSIREFGVIQPLIVTKVVTDLEHGAAVEYELIAGERRLMAARMAGLRTVPVVVRRASTDREKLEIAIIENIQRRDLNPIETAKAFARLQDEFKLTQREIAARLGKSREAVANAVRLLHLPLEIQTAVSSGQLSESQARLLLSLSDIGEQNKLFNEIIGNKLSVREIRTRISRKKSEMEPQVAYTDPETSALRERLEEFLGTKVDLKDEGDAGRITINFYSKEELRGILQKLFHEGNS